MSGTRPIRSVQWTLIYGSEFGGRLVVLTCFTHMGRGILLALAGEAHGVTTRHTTTKVGGKFGCGTAHEASEDDWRSLGFFLPSDKHVLDLVLVIRCWCWIIGDSGGGVADSPTRPREYIRVDEEAVRDVILFVGWAPDLLHEGRMTLQFPLDTSNREIELVGVVLERDNVAASSQRAQDL